MPRRSARLRTLMWLAPSLKPTAGHSWRVALQQARVASTGSVDHGPLLAGRQVVRQLLAPPGLAGIGTGIGGIALVGVTPKCAMLTHSG